MRLTGARRAGMALFAAHLAACSSTTVIRSNPSGARLYLNGEAVGTTPYAMTDSKIVGSAAALPLGAPRVPPGGGPRGRPAGPDGAADRAAGRAGAGAARTGAGTRAGAERGGAGGGG